MSDSPVPRRAELLLEALGADTSFREDVIGDLAEEFEIRLRWDGPRVARRWYYRESLRVAPYLVRDWWRNLTWRHTGYFANVLLWTLLSLWVLEFLLKRVAHGILELPQGVPLLVTALLSWTLIDGVFAGYLAARIGRRAPLPSALLVAITVVGVMIWSGWRGVPPWFLAANVTAMAAGTVAGGALRILRSVRAR